MSNMTCEYFGVCGSCTYHDKSYETQLALKVDAIKEDFELKTLDILTSQPEHFRNRAEFKIYHDDGKISYAMSRLDKKGVVRIDSCSIVSKAIATVMTPLLEALQKNAILEFKLFAIEFLSSSTGELLITLIYHKKIDQTWKIEAEKLAKTFGIMIIGRSRKVKIVCEDDFIHDTLTINQDPYHYKLYDTGFIQPNTKVNEKMIGWVKQAIDHSDRDLLELYCGHGNFTIPLASKFRKVLATEISKNSIKAAKENCLLNNTTNISFVRLSSEELTSALKREREFRRLEGIELDSYDFSHVFVDPPRAGLDEKSLAFISKFENIIYVSCNPQTLKRDLETLKKCYDVQDFAVFDQFAYTHHLECGVVLKKRKDDDE
jgi:tRNA (uracil-5-)-methyltransferase